MKNTASDNDGKFTRRALLQAVGATAALRIMGNQKAFALPVSTGDAKKDAYVAVALARAITHQPPVSTSIATNPSDLHLKTNAFHQRRLESLAYAADLNFHPNDYAGGDRQKGLEFLDGVARGAAVDPSDYRLTRGMNTILGITPEGGVNLEGPSYIPQLSPEAAKAADFISDMAIGAAGTGIGLILSGTKAVIKDPKIIDSIGKLGGLEYGGTKLNTDYLWEQLDTEATARAYGLGLNFTKDELKEYEARYGIDFSSSFDEHVEKLPKSWKNIVGVVRKAQTDKAANIKSDKEVAKEIAILVTDQLSVDLSKFRSEIAKEVAAKIQKDTVKAEEARVEQQRILGEIKGGAYIASFLADSFLDKESAATIKKLTDAGVSIASMAAAGAALGPVGWVAGALAIAISLSNDGPTFEDQLMKMMGELSESLRQFRKENIELHVQTQQMVRYAIELQYETLDRLNTLIDKAKVGNVIAIEQLKQAWDLHKVEMNFEIQEAQGGLARNFLKSRETLQTEAGDKERKKKKFFDLPRVQDAMETIYVHALSNDTASLTRKDADVGNPQSLSSVLSTLHHVAYAVGIIPSIYEPLIAKKKMGAAQTQREFASPVNPVETARAAFAFADALTMFPEAENPRGDMVHRIEKIRTALRESLAVMRNATDLAKIRELTQEYTKNAAEIFDEYVLNAYQQFLKDEGVLREFSKSSPKIVHQENRELLICEDESTFQKINANCDVIQDYPNQIINSKKHNGCFVLKEDNRNHSWNDLFRTECGQDMLWYAERFGLIRIDEVSSGHKSEQTAGALFEKDRTLYKITFLDGQFRGKEFQFSSFDFKSAALGAVIGEPEPPHPTRLVSLAKESEGLELKPTDPTAPSFKLNNTKDMLKLISTELTARHKNLRERFLQKIKDDFREEKFWQTPNMNQALKKKAEETKTLGLGLQYLTGLRHWLDTGDAKTATSIATRDITNGFPVVPVGIPVFPNDLANFDFNVKEKGASSSPLKTDTTDGSIRTKIPSNIAEIMKGKAEKIINNDFDASLRTTFPEERTINIPEATMAEFAMLQATELGKQKSAAAKGR
jgi:hypothetical protein